MEFRRESTGELRSLLGRSECGFCRVDTDDDDIPDTAGAVGEFSIVATAGGDYDSIEVRSAGSVIITDDNGTLGWLAGDGIYLDNVGDGLPTPQLASIT